jgi:hypothetical protein
LRLRARVACTCELETVSHCIQPGVKSRLDHRTQAGSSGSVNRLGATVTHCSLLTVSGRDYVDETHEIVLNWTDRFPLMQRTANSRDANVLQIISRQEHWQVSSGPSKISKQPVTGHVDIRMSASRSRSSFGSRLQTPRLGLTAGGASYAYVHAQPPQPGSLSARGPSWATRSRRILAGMRPGAGHA